MSWFSENKFLAVFGGVMLVGAGALGYLTMGASAAYSTALDEYKGAASSLSSVSSARPAPLPENLEAANAKVKTIKAQIETFQRTLSAIEIKLEPVTTTGFQDRLKESVAKVLAKAGEMETKLPDKFYLGFDEYQNLPPKEAAAPLLLRQLRAFEIFMGLLFDAKGAELKKITRAELPEEKRQAEPPKNDKNKGGRPEAPKLIQKLSFQVEFATSQEHAQRVLNGIVGNKQQFFVVRNIHVRNEKPEPPSTNPTGPGGVALPPGVPAPAAPVSPDGTPAPAAAPEKPGLEAVFGNEKVEMTLDIDVLDFAEPEAPAVEKGSSKSK